MSYEEKPSEDDLNINYERLAREALDNARSSLMFQQAVHFSSSPKSEPIIHPFPVRQCTRDLAKKLQDSKDE